MKAVLCPLFVLFLILPLISFAKTYTTNFDATENPISEGNLWNHTGLDWTMVQSAGGLAYGTQTGTHTGSAMYDDSYAYLSGFGPDQSAWAVVQRTSGAAGNHEAEILLRWSDAAHSAQGYECLLPYDGQYPPHIVKWNGALGNFTILKRGDVTVLAKTGDVWKASIKGNLIIGYLNGTEVIRVTDNTYTSGGPGMGFYREQGGTCSDMAYTNFTATDSLGTPDEIPAAEIPDQPSLSQNSPNPFNPLTTINYVLPSKAFVALKVYDMGGQQIATLVNGEKPAGHHTAHFDGAQLSSGVFSVRMTAGNFAQTRKMLLAR